jgi:hypothetical protein
MADCSDAESTGNYHGLTFEGRWVIEMSDKVAVSISSALVQAHDSKDTFQYHISGIQTRQSDAARLRFVFYLFLVPSPLESRG